MNSVLTVGRSWTEERQAEKRLIGHEAPWKLCSLWMSKLDWRQAEVRPRSGGPLGALFSLEVAAGLKEYRPRRGLGQ